ncbi:MAG: hypothetical protein ACO388_02885 [Saprospiraceae bacterium]|jgi:chromosome segregation ATPase
MKSKIVLWGKNDQGEKVLFALELLEDINKVTTYWFADEKVTEEFHQKIMDDWRAGTSVDFPEGFGQAEFELTVTGSLLPEGCAADKEELLKRWQSESNFVVLSKKLNEAYHSELDEIKERIERLEKFENGVWEELKGFWSKVQKQVEDKNLLREQANGLKTKTNDLFATLKELRVKMDDAFKSNSVQLKQEFTDLLNKMQLEMEEGRRLKPLFEELKNLQRKIKEAALTREHRGKVWEQLDSLFKVVKEKRFGSEKEQEGSAMERLQRRYKGLLEALNRMEQSIQRDKQELSFQNKKASFSEGQLEAQLRQAKVVMVEGRLSSKMEKLSDMNKTKADLERRMKKEEEKAARMAEQQKIEEVKKEVELKMAEKVGETTLAVDEQTAEKLEEAAKAMKQSKQKSMRKKVEEVADKVEDLVEDMAEEAEDFLEDLIASAKAIAEIVEEKVERTIDQIKNK